MSTVGTVQEIWRYPVKSMRGEQLESVFVAFSGLMGDRVYGLINNEADPAFPWHTAREQEPLLLYTPRFVDGAGTRRPARGRRRPSVPTDTRARSLPRGPVRRVQGSRAL